MAAAAGAVSSDASVIRDKSSLSNHEQIKAIDAVWKATLLFEQ